ncbi:MAG: hypothetical protein C5B48_05820 [Candidatus Rokuibacteriota bacterium]|nr:MAG: hypothetical protein C5B48_05820 [Candidatus Rokubacteria bacterium]
MNARHAVADLGRTGTGSNRRVPTTFFTHLYGPSRKTAPRALAGALILCVVGASAALAAPVQLLLPQSTAFAILGHSCGGIQERAYATGFDPASGDPIGDVYIQTRCGGSGRGGGYHTTTYSAWVAVTWDFTGKALSSAKLASAPTVNPTLSAADASGDTVYNANGAAYLTVAVSAAPTGVTAVQSGDQFHVSWTPEGVNPIAITSSILTATPVSSTASMLTTTVVGSATSGLIGPLQPETTYQITVVNTTIAGSGPASTPISVTTAAASVVPSAPTGVTAHWTGSGDTTAMLVATWNAAVPGDSPVDEYEVLITGSDGGGTFTQTVSGVTLTASFTVDNIPDWTVMVRAHNAAGWGPWSASFTLGGL